MKYIEDATTTVKILNSGYIPPGESPCADERFYSMVVGVQEQLANLSIELSIFTYADYKHKMQPSFTWAYSVYDNYQGDNAIRLEVSSWRLMTGGLIRTVSQFLKVAAPEFCVVVTSDIDDCNLRALESPIIVIFSDKVIGQFESCDLDDTKTSLGF